jgi:pSer/pThr/pTyr-binding forkhead associated (FHA) protein
VYALRYAGNVVPLKGGELVVGRHPSCNLVFPGAKVSRRHARFSAAAGVSVEDLGSANGVFVNGARVEGKVRLAIGDRVVVGDVDIEIVAVADEEEMDDFRVTQVGEIPESRRNPTAAADDDPDSSLPGSKTVKGEALLMLGEVADKMLAQGQVDGAERLLSVRLTRIIEEANAGVPHPDVTLQAATEYSMKLARASRRASWVHTLFNLYAAHATPMPLELIDELYEIVRTIPGVRVEPLSSYMQTLEAAKDRLGPTARFSLQRLEGLHRLIVSR